MSANGQCFVCWRLSPFSCVHHQAHPSSILGASREERVLARLTHVLGTMYLCNPCKRGPSRRFSPLSPLPSFPWGGRNHPCPVATMYCVTAVYGHSSHTPANKTDTPARRPAHLDCPSPTLKVTLKVTLSETPVQISSAPSRGPGLNSAHPSHLLPPPPLPHVITSPSSDFASTSRTKEGRAPASRKKKNSSPNARSQQIGPCSSPTNARRTYSRRHISAPTSISPPAPSGTSRIPTYLPPSERTKTSQATSACKSPIRRNLGPASLVCHHTPAAAPPRRSAQAQRSDRPPHYTTSRRNSDTLPFQLDISPETRPRTRTRPERRSLITTTSTVRSPRANSAAQPATPLFRTVTPD